MSASPPSSGPPPPGWTPAVPPRPDPATQTPGPGPRRAPVRLMVLIGVVVLAVVVAGVVGVAALRDGSSGSDGAAGPAPAVRDQGPMPTTDPALAKFYDQDLDWQDCGDNQCTKVTVPLDYADPTGKTIRLAMIKVPASGRSLGPLVVNPGGPGGSAIQYASSGQAWPSAIRKHFDLVGFDPRGVGESTPLKCMDTEETDDYVASDPDPDDAEERAEYAEQRKDFGDDCLSESGDLARHVSTTEVVRDLDIVRAVLKQPKLDYFGASYGTTIGAQYAGRFPTHVGRMVLDGAIEQGMTNEQLNLGQAKGFQTALRAYVSSCVSKDDCPLGDSVDAGLTRIKEFVQSVESDPLPVRGDRTLEVGNAFYGVILPLYDKSYWPLLTRALEDAIEDQDGTLLMALSDAYAHRGPNGYTDNSVQVFPAVSCLDDSSGVPVDQVPSYVPQFEQASPTFGESFAYSLAGCYSWPIKATEPLEPVTAAGAPPIVVVGTTRDPATPYAWAVALAKQLQTGVLVSRDGDGHTGFNQGNACTDDAVEGWLLDGKAPKDGLSC